MPWEGDTGAEGFKAFVKHWDKHARTRKPKTLEVRVTGRKDTLENRTRGGEAWKTKRWTAKTVAQCLDRLVVVESDEPSMVGKTITELRAEARKAGIPIKEGPGQQGAGGGVHHSLENGLPLAAVSCWGMQVFELRMDA